MGVVINSIAYALPDKVVTNDELRANFPEWDFDRLAERTGVTERRIAGKNETAIDLAERACRELGKTSDLSEIDGLIFCTETPDYLIPSNAGVLHGRLGLENRVFSIDLNMGCSGFIYGLEIARGLLSLGSAKRILFVTADTYSRHINDKDRATRVLFGDGGAATVVSITSEKRGIIDTAMGSDGTKFDRFFIAAGGAREPRTAETARETTDRSGNLRSREDIFMDGLGVLSFFNATIPDHVKKLLSQNNITIDQVDHFVFHQASWLALSAISKSLGLPASKWAFEMQKTGNLVSASIPVVLHKMFAKGSLKPDDLVVLCGFGVGLSWGTTLIRF